MKIDFTQHKLHLVITPLDMRLGFNRLAEIALVYLHIDVKKGRDLVAFVSKNRKIAQWGCGQNPGLKPGERHYFFIQRST